MPQRYPSFSDSLATAPKEGVAIELIPALFALWPARTRDTSDLLKDENPAIGLFVISYQYLREGNRRQNMDREIT